MAKQKIKRHISVIVWFLRGTSDFLHLFALLPPGRRLRLQMILWKSSWFSAILGTLFVSGVPSTSSCGGSDFSYMSQSYLSNLITLAAPENATGFYAGARLTEDVSSYLKTALWSQCVEEVQGSSAHRVMAPWMGKLWEGEDDDEDDDDDWLVVWNINFIFPYIGNNHPNWLIFFRGVQTTNLMMMMMMMMMRRRRRRMRMMRHFTVGATYFQTYI